MGKWERGERESERERGGGRDYRIRQTGVYRSLSPNDRK